MGMRLGGDNGNLTPSQAAWIVVACVLALAIIKLTEWVV